MSSCDLRNRSRFKDIHEIVNVADPSANVTIIKETLD